MITSRAGSIVSAADLSKDWKSEVAIDFALFSMCCDSVKRAGAYRQAAKMVANIFT
jgi:hypothetical protein